MCAKKLISPHSQVENKGYVFEKKLIGFHQFRVIFRFTGFQMFSNHVGRLFTHSSNISVVIYNAHCRLHKTTSSQIKQHLRFQVCIGSCNRHYCQTIKTVERAKNQNQPIRTLRYFLLVQYFLRIKPGKVFIALFHMKSWNKSLIDLARPGSLTGKLNIEQRSQFSVCTVQYAFLRTVQDLGPIFSQCTCNPRRAFIRYFITIKNEHFYFEF